MTTGPANGEQHKQEITYRPYDQTPEDLQHIVRLVETELSEPYTVYTYRYFLHQWPSLAFLAFATGDDQNAVGIVVCKLETHRGKTMRGYLAMLSVHPDWRNQGIAKHLLRLAIEQMKEQGADEVVLETEADNEKSLGLYERLGFWREKRLWRFYLNGKDAFRLILPLKTPPPPRPPPTVYSPPPPVHIEDDFGSAPFLSADTFAPAPGTAPSPLELSPALAALVERAHEENDGDEGTQLPSSCPALVGKGIELDEEGEEGDVETEDLSLASPTRRPSPPSEGSGPPLVRNEDDDDDKYDDLEALEVSDEEGTTANAGGSDESDDAVDRGDWEGGRRLTEGLTGVSL